MNEETAKSRRSIRSFVTRGGRMTVAQQKAFDTCWPRWGLEIETGLLSFDEIFGREAPTVLEIGFGMGQSLAEMATEHPDWNFIGVEVHRPGVGKLFHTLEEAGLDNVRVFNADALDVVNHCIPSASLDRVQIYFPDPWHKKRHHKRRLIQSEFVDALTQRLKSGGELHLATDWENYAEHMLDVLGDQPELSNKAEDDGFLPRPDSRPLTKFELRGQRLGHGVWDLVFIRR